MLQASELEQSESGTTLVLHHGLQPSYNAIGAVVKQFGLKIDTRASTATAINVNDSSNYFGAPEAQQYVLLLQPEHVSKVIVDVANVDGTKVTRELEDRILEEIQEALSGAA